jgi:hypothetical protein
MMIPAVFLALVQTDLQTTLLVALGFLVANTVIGHILEPRIMSRGLGIYALVVFHSLMRYAMRREMSSRGYQRSDNPDLLINFFVNTGIKQHRH